MLIPLRRCGFVLYSSQGFPFPRLTSKQDAVRKLTPLSFRPFVAFDSDAKKIKRK